MKNAIIEILYNHSAKKHSTAEFEYKSHIYLKGKGFIFKCAMRKLRNDNGKLWTISNWTRVKWCYPEIVRNYSILVLSLR